MEYRTLGQTDLEVSAVIFGAWAIGGWFWDGTDDDLAIKAIHTAIDSGVNCIDTAPMYGMGHSEIVVGRALKDISEKIIVATKCGLVWYRTDGEYFFDTKDNEGKECSVYRVLKKDSIIEECEKSLQRLGVEVIDLYQCHWPDKTTPLDETMDAMLTLKQQGKIRAIGVSNFTAGMMATCLKHGRLDSCQPKYSLLSREPEEEILPFCREHNIGVICYSPMEQGMLTGKVTMDREFKGDDNRQRKPWFQLHNRKRALEALEKIKPIAEKYGVTLAQLSVNWIISQPGVTAAIVGARNPDQARENAKAADFKLSDEDIQNIRDVFEALGPPE